MVGKVDTSSSPHEAVVSWTYELSLEELVLLCGGDQSLHLHHGRCTAGERMALQRAAFSVKASQRLKLSRNCLRINSVTDVN